MTDIDTSSVLAVAKHLAVLGRLDEKSYRGLPARLTTLLRRVVDATSHELGRTLCAVAPPPRREPAGDYAAALIELFEAFEALAARDLRRSIERIGDRLDALAFTAGRTPVAEPAGAVVLEDAFLWKAAALVSDGNGDEHVALAEAHVALAGEGALPTGYGAMRAAAFLSAHATLIPDESRAARYATIALELGPGEYAFPKALLDCVTILRRAERYDVLVERALPLLDAYDVFDETDVEPYEDFTAFVVRVAIECSLALSALGRHEQATECAGHALWRSIRRFGTDARLTLACQAALADRLSAAGRHADAAEMARPAFTGLRRFAAAAPEAYVYTGITLATSLEQTGDLEGAREAAIALETFASAHLPPDDQTLLDAVATRRHLESST